MMDKIENDFVKTKNVIFFSINDAYCFALASILMDLKRHSEEFMRDCDVIVYHDGISEFNKELLGKILNNIYFAPMIFPACFAPILEHERTKQWGEYVHSKFFGFELVKKYKGALYLDVDMHLKGDISDIFKSDAEIVWRKIIAWDQAVNFSSVLPPDYSRKHLKSGNGGMILFSEKLNKYQIDLETVAAAFEKSKFVKRGGLDESLMSFLVYENKISVEEVDANIYNTPMSHLCDETRLVHFNDYRVMSPKPWKNLATYLYFDEWRENYRTWLEMGGKGPINYTKEDYYRLFSFDKAKEIQKLKDENARLKKKLDYLTNSRSWKLTKPLRYIMKLLKKLKP